MKTCKHIMKDGEVRTGIVTPPTYDCIFCERDRLAARLAEAELKAQAGEMKATNLIASIRVVEGERDALRAELAECRAKLEQASADILTVMAGEKAAEARAERLLAVVRYVNERAGPTSGPTGSNKTLCASCGGVVLMAETECPACRHPKDEPHDFVRCCFVDLRTARRIANGQRNFINVTGEVRATDVRVGDRLTVIGQDPNNPERVEIEVTVDGHRHMRGMLGGTDVIYVRLAESTGRAKRARG